MNSAGLIVSAKGARQLSMNVIKNLAAITLCVAVIEIGVAFAQDPSARTDPKIARPSAQANANELSPVARAAVDRAIAALQSNALADAERFAREAVQAAPGSSIAHNMLGVVLDRLARKDEALDHFNAAVKLDPAFVSGRNNLGRFLAERGERTEAIKQFEQVLKIDPAHVQAHFNLGVLYSEAGEYQ